MTKGSVFQKQDQVFVMKTWVRFWFLQGLECGHFWGRFWFQFRENIVFIFRQWYWYLKAPILRFLGERSVRTPGMLGCTPEELGTSWVRDLASAPVREFVGTRLHSSRPHSKKLPKSADLNRAECQITLALVPARDLAPGYCQPHVLHSNP